MIGAINRRNSYLKAVRKRRIDMAVSYCFYYRDDPERDYGRYSNLHQYSKNKIHCSCPLCSAKTRNKGRRDRKNYAPSINYKISDQRKIDRLMYAE